MQEVEESKESDQNNLDEIRYDFGFNYVDVVCGSSQTLAIVDKSPYLLAWGNGDPSAKTYSEVF